MIISSSAPAGSGYPLPASPMNKSFRIALGSVGSSEVILRDLIALYL